MWSKNFLTFTTKAHSLTEKKIWFFNKLSMDQNLHQHGRNENDPGRRKSHLASNDQACFWSWKVSQIDSNQRSNYSEAEGLTVSALENLTVDVNVPLMGGKVHGSLARAGKVRGQTPKVEAGEKKKKKTGCAKQRFQYIRRFVNMVAGFGKKKGPNSNS